MKKYLTSIFFLLAAFSLAAQTAADLDILLETNEVSAAQAARFVLEAVELLPPGLSGAVAESVAYDRAKMRGWLKGAAEDAISLQDAAFLVMSAFAFRGGLMYFLLPGPRYAYREMVYRRLIQGRPDPTMTVSGPLLLQIIGRSLEYSGDAR